MLIDTHAHIQLEAYDDSRDVVVQRALDSDIEYIICPGIDIPSSHNAVQLADRYDAVFAAVGIHPHDADDVPDDWLRQLEKLSQHPKVVAIGEMGLDYFKNYSPRNVQKHVFQQQIELAGELELPIIVHNRESDPDMKDILTRYGTGSGVMHCFTSDLTMAKAMVALGYYISFSGIATFGNTTVEQAISGLDLQDLLVETDAPFLAPVPRRGKTNEPAFVRYTAEKVAELKAISFAEVAETTTQNAIRLFGLPV